MTQWISNIPKLLIIPMLLAWVVAAWCFVVFALELRRARRDGEAVVLPPRRKNRPRLPRLIIVENILPRVETQRRILVWAVVIFFLFWLVVMLVGIMVGSGWLPPPKV